MSKNTAAGVPETPYTEQVTDDEDFEKFRLTEENLASFGNKAMSQVEIRKPDKETFFRVKEGWLYEAAILDAKKLGKGIYLVDPSLVDMPSIKNLVSRTVLVAAYTDDGIYFLIPLKLPRKGMSPGSWFNSMMTAINKAKENWIRLSADTSKGYYDIWVARGEIPQPPLPEEIHSMTDLLKSAFKEMKITTTTHEVIQLLEKGRSSDIL